MKKRALFSRIVAVCLALTLTLAMAIPTIALHVNDTGTITVKGTTTDNGVTVNAYKLIEVNWDEANNEPVEPEYKWAKGMTEWLKANDTYKDYIADDNGVTDAFDALDAAGQSAFYAAVRDALENKTLTLSAATAEAVAMTDGTAAFTDVSMGQYLIVANATAKRAPIVANLVPVYENNNWTLNDVTVYLKDSKPDISKEVTSDDHTVKIGDTVDYQLTVTAPAYPDDVTDAYFIVGDKLPAGLDLVANSVVVKAKETVLQEDKYELDTNPTSKGFTVKFIGEDYDKSTHNRRERPVYGLCGGSRGRLYYMITTFEERPWDARDPIRPHSWH